VHSFNRLAVYYVGRCSMLVTISFDVPCLRMGRCRNSVTCPCRVTCDHMEASIVRHRFSQDCQFSWQSALKAHEFSSMRQVGRMNVHLCPPHPHPRPSLRPSPFALPAPSPPSHLPAQPPLLVSYSAPRNLIPQSPAAACAVNSCPLYANKCCFASLATLHFTCNERGGATIGANTVHVAHSQSCIRVWSGSMRLEVQCTAQHCDSSAIEQHVF
jgi:hypothetical protein